MIKDSHDDTVKKYTWFTLLLFKNEVPQLCCTYVESQKETVKTFQLDLCQCKYNMFPSLWREN